MSRACRGNVKVSALSYNFLLSIMRSASSIAFCDMIRENDLLHNGSCRLFPDLDRSKKNVLSTVGIVLSFWSVVASG